MGFSAEFFILTSNIFPRSTHIAFEMRAIISVLQAVVL